MKRFLLFIVGAGETSYGGWDDFRGSFDSQLEAHAEVVRHYATGWSPRDRWQIVDITTGELKEGGKEV